VDCPEILGDDVFNQTVASTMQVSTLDLMVREVKRNYLQN